ncbi:hypothetical protein NDK47_06770 [Brevibacillus ruminantium]|uniref:Uncharacterized protein n=1 Tax=Brevibacillus ruminantium TaxID=2950604 RepID=A0ABY4WLQ4_9BACL|nr:hypothetical protein [Brevibacillus ruminantium]USG66992.1 hypothetical protein NDK47_06770 [Brevibacillus ruminantium]
MKRYLSLGLAFSLAIVGNFTLTEGASAKVCDNDPLRSSGCTHAYRSYNSSWDYESNQSGSYNKDHRIIRQEEASWYEWGMGDLPSGRATLEVYLAHADFTNRQARYYVLHEGLSTEEYVGNVNQYSARSGWNEVGTIRLDAGRVWVILDGSDWSGRTNTYTGADAVSL